MANERMDEAQVVDFLEKIPVGACILVECDEPNPKQRLLAVSHKIGVLGGSLRMITVDQTNSYLRREDSRNPWMLFERGKKAAKVTWVGQG